MLNVNMPSISQISQILDELQVPDCIKQFISTIINDLEVEKKKEIIKKIFEELGISIDETEIKIENGKIYVKKEWDIPHIFCQISTPYGDEISRCFVTLLLIEGYSDESWNYTEYKKPEYKKPMEIEMNGDKYYFTLKLKLETELKDS